MTDLTKTHAVAVVTSFFNQENEHNYSLTDENLPKIMTLISKKCNRDDWF